MIKQFCRKRLAALAPRWNLIIGGGRHAVQSAVAHKDIKWLVIEMKPCSRHTERWQVKQTALTI